MLPLQYGSLLREQLTVNHDRRRHNCDLPTHLCPFPLYSLVSLVSWGWHCGSVNTPCLCWAQSLTKPVYIIYIYINLYIKSLPLVSIWTSLLVQKAKVWFVCMFRNYSFQLSKSFLKDEPISWIMSEVVVDLPCCWNACLLHCLVSEQAPNAATNEGFILQKYKKHIHDHAY